MRSEEAARPGVDLVDAATLGGLVAARGGVGGSSSQAAEERLGEATHLRLDRERVESIGEEIGDLLPATTHLYLQHNRLRRPGGVLGLGALRFLTLAHNALEDLQGFSVLRNLFFLDVSHNRIRTCGPGDLPASLRFLKLEGNPCSAEPARTAALRVALVADLENLEEIDGQPFTPKELLAAGYDPDSDWEEEERREELAGKFRLAQAAGGGVAALVPSGPGSGPESEDEEPVSELERQIAADIDREVELERGRLLLERDGALRREVGLLKAALPQLQGQSPGAELVDAAGAAGAFDSMVGGDRGSIQAVRQLALERARARVEDFRRVQEATELQIKTCKQKIGELLQAGKPVGAATASSRPGSSCSGGVPAARPSPAGGGRRGPGGGTARPVARPGTAPAPVARRRPGSAALTRPAPLEI